MLGSRFFAKTRHVFGTPLFQMNPKTILRFSSTSSLCSSAKRIDLQITQIDLNSIVDVSQSFRAPSKSDNIEAIKDEMDLEEILFRDVECLWEVKGTLGKLVAIEETKMNCSIKTRRNIQVNYL